MSSIKLLETKMRSEKFATHDEARKSLLGHALAGEYLLETLIKRGVLQGNEDGGVDGVSDGASRRIRSDGPPGKDRAWYPTWPDRDVLLCSMAGSQKTVLRDIKKFLDEQGEPHAHWTTVNALKRLIREGAVVKKGLFYLDAESLQPPVNPFLPIWQGVSEEARNAVRLALSAPGMAADDVTAALKDHETFAEWKVKAFSQPFIDAVKGFIAQEPKAAAPQEVKP